MTPPDSSSQDYLLEEGTVINGKWEILSFIAKGGKGEVYLARQLSLNRKVALKIMSMDFLKSLEGDEGEITSETKRFHREVQIMAGIQHPNVLKVFDFDQLDNEGTLMDCIAMEYIPGPTLRQKMPREGLGHDEAKVAKWISTYFLPILVGMKAVHAKGVIHRDMKPENVLIGDEPPKIMDFGVAGGYHMEDVTRTHHMIGTITYMPEEQFLDLALTDARVDIYALGKILYEMVEGKMVKGRDKPFHQVGLKNPEGPFFTALDRIIRQATTRNRNQRTASVKDLMDSLKELVADCGHVPPRRMGHGKMNRRLLLGICFGLCLLGIGAVFHFDPLNPTELGQEAHKTETLSSDSGFDPALPEFTFKTPRSTKAPDGNTALPQSLIASDNMTMILVKGGTVTLPMKNLTDDQRQAETGTFYMDKTKVTNHLYVQFLHELKEVAVRENSVFWNGRLLLLLGEVADGYEPITYRDNVFRVKPDDAARPVVWVTPAGALAYARYYGRTLPSMAQWWIAGGSDPEPEIATGTIPVVNSVTHTRANSQGVQGLKENVHEWTVIKSADASSRFYFHSQANKETYLERRSWEAFANVGFRTVLNLGEKR